MKKQRSIVTQTVMRVSGVFITAIILLTIVFTIFIGRYMRDNILGVRRSSWSLWQIRWTAG